MSISITKRVRNAMVGMVVVLCVLFTALIFVMVYIIEDQVFVNQVKVEQAAFEHVIADGDLQKIVDWKPSNGNVKRVDSADNLPASLPESMVKTIVSDKGVHEYFDDENAMFIASQVRVDNGAPYYLVYDVKNLLVVRSTKRTLLMLIGFLTMLITLVSVMFARRITTSTFAPASRLSNALKNNDLDHVVIELANEFSDDEIGVLTQELARAIERVKESAQREYEFNRSVSHELRSPIQVAQSATELLQIYVGESDTKIAKPIERLHRSISEMNEIAEAFLWLASDRIVSQSEMCSAATLQSSLNTINSAFFNQELVVNASAAASFRYPMPATVLSVVLRSLVRNAATHGDLSPIQININTDDITVNNSVDLPASEIKGFGIGLSIVQRICDRFECQLKTELNNSQYSSSIIFEPSSGRDA